MSPVSDRIYYIFICNMLYIMTSLYIICYILWHYFGVFCVSCVRPDIIHLYICIIWNILWHYFGVFCVSCVRPDLFNLNIYYVILCHYFCVFCVSCVRSDLFNLNIYYVIYYMYDIISVSFVSLVSDRMYSILIYIML